MLKYVAWSGLGLLIIAAIVGIGIGVQKYQYHAAEERAAMKSSLTDHEDPTMRQYGEIIFRYHEEGRGLDYLVETAKSFNAEFRGRAMYRSGDRAAMVEHITRGQYTSTWRGIVKVNADKREAREDLHEHGLPTQHWKIRELPEPQRRQTAVAE